MVKVIQYLERAEITVGFYGTAEISITPQADGSVQVEIHQPDLPEDKAYDSIRQTSFDFFPIKTDQGR